jgi:hypothetical protein
MDKHAHALVIQTDTVEARLANCNRAISAAGTPYPHGSVERVKRRRHVTWIRRHAVVAPPEDRVDPIDAFAGTAAVPWLPFVARHGGVVEVLAPRPLQQVAAICGHVAQLPGGARHYGLREVRIVLRMNE